MAAAAATIGGTSGALQAALASIVSRPHAELGKNQREQNCNAASVHSDDSDLAKAYIACMLH